MAKREDAKPAAIGSGFQGWFARMTTEWQACGVPGIDPIAVDRLRRVLSFLAVSGGAALLSKRGRCIVAASGEVDESAAVAAIGIALESPDAIVHVAPDGLIADVGRDHRLFVRVPRGQRLLLPALRGVLRRRVRRPSDHGLSDHVPG